VHPAAEDAPPLATAFLATVAVGAVSFLLLQFWQEYSWLRASDLAASVLRVGGIVLLIFVAVIGWAQRSFARVMACGILIEIGCAVLLVSAGTPLSVASIGFSVIARALSLGLLCLGVWRLREMRGSDAFDRVRGVRDMWTALAIAVGGLSLIGLPGTLGFVARWSAARAFGASDAEGLVLLLLASASVAVALVRGLIALYDEPYAGGPVVPSGRVCDQLPLFEELTTPASEPGSEARPGEGAIEGEAVLAHVVPLGSVGARFVVGLGVALVLILGLWPGVIAPLAQAAAMQYSFYR
jgi:formate hydrogenlyase subunit 3/multisubunit Na+/H+ antiporter MnhD subunit